MGIVRTPICGTHVCGDGTICGQWEAHHGRSTLLLNGRGFAAGWIPDGITGVTLGRPKLILRSRVLVLAKDTQLFFARPKLTLTGRAFLLPVLTRVAPGRPLLILRPRAFVIALSTSLAVGRPLLILRGGELQRAGRPGMVPTVPESATLTPSAVESRTLTPSAVESALLTPTKTAVR